MQIYSVAEFERALDHGPYAWPGGFPCYFVMADGAAMSFEAAKNEKETIIRAMEDRKDGYNDTQWIPSAFEINYEDDDLYCAHTNEKIECAYPKETKP